MIILTDVAAKLEEILNSEDCPTDFQFVVKSQGYHLDSIVDKKKGINKIPVFLTMVGGNYNPVPNLHQASFTYGVNIWFPIRFKETFYALNEYLESVFVGKKIEISGVPALCNISVAQYGEIVGVHLDQFEEWVNNEYNDNVHLFKNEEDISEDYMNMEFNIFATTLGDGFLLGNDIKYTLKMTFPQLSVTKMLVNYHYKVFETEHDVELVAIRDSTKDEIVGGTTKYYAWTVTFISSVTIYTTTITYSQLNSSTKFYTKENNAFTENSAFTFIDIQETQFDDSSTITLTENLVWDSSGTGASISPISEQLIGNDKFARNIPNITNFNKSIVVYPKNNEFWGYFLICYNAQNLDRIKSVKLTKEYNFGSVKRTYEFTQIVLNYNENITLGEPLSFTLTFGD